MNFNNKLFLFLHTLFFLENTLLANFTSKVTFAQGARALVEYRSVVRLYRKNDSTTPAGDAGADAAICDFSAGPCAHVLRIGSNAELQSHRRELGSRGEADLGPA